MKGWVVWITGLPASGKSTLARRIQARLREERIPSVLLDGDEVREALEPNPAYEPPARDAFYAALARLAAAIARQELVVLVAATANRQRHREKARKLAPRFLEVYLDTPLEECLRRDAKGLYARAREGRAPSLPGLGEPYESPPHPDVVAHGGQSDPAVEEVLRRLRAA